MSTLHFLHYITTSRCWWTVRCGWKVWKSFNLQIYFKKMLLFRTSPCSGLLKNPTQIKRQALPSSVLCLERILHIWKLLLINDVPSIISLFVQLCVSHPGSLTVSLSSPICLSHSAPAAWYPTAPWSRYPRPLDPPPPLPPPPPPLSMTSPLLYKVSTPPPPAQPP